MSRPGVTYQEVAEAASQLLAQGRHPTIEQIRLILGTGSSTTLANHLKQWKERQNGTRLLAAKENMPDELVGMLKGLWERVLDHAEEKISVAEATYQQSLQDKEQALEKYKHNNQRWQQLFHQWAKDKEQLMTTQAALEELVQTLQNDKAAMQSTLEGQRQQLIEKQDRIDELFRLHKQAQANLEYDREVVRYERLEEQHAKDVLEKKYSQALVDLTTQASELLAIGDVLRDKTLQIAGYQADIQSLKHQLELAANLNKSLEQDKWKLEGQLKERENLLGSFA